MSGRRIDRFAGLARGSAAVALLAGLLLAVLPASAAPSSAWGVTATLPGVTLYAVTCPSATVCYAVGGSATFNPVAYRSADAGADWTALSLPTETGPLQALSCPAVSTCFATSGSATRGRVYETTNSGATWVVHDTPANEDGLEGISCPTTSDCTVVLGYNLSPSSVLFTSNGGASWTSVTTTVGLASVSCANTTDCVATGYVGKVLTTSDGWRTSEASTFADDGTAGLAVTCASSLVCVVGSGTTTTHGAAFVTGDGGANWSLGESSASLPALTGISCASSLVCTAVGSGTLNTGVAIVQSVDGGTTWTTVTVPSGVRSLMDVSCSPGGPCLAVGEETTGAAAFLTGPNPVTKGPRITTSSLPAATVGVPYSAQLAETGGTGPFDWTVAAGSLPTGLAMDRSGLISGTAGSPGTSSFTVSVTDTNDVSSSQPLVLSVETPPAPPPSPPPPPPVPQPGCSSTGIGSASFPGGYWLATATGAVYSCGDAPFYGSLATLGVAPAKPIVGIAASPDDHGYWLVASDGGIFAFGDAQFFGSMGGKPLNDPVVGIAASDRGGYYEVASDGGLFAFGPGATFHGSMGGRPLNEPVVGMAVTTQGGYYEVASDGGLFAFGPGATFHGSMGGRPLNKPVVGMAITPSGGYDEVAADGGVFAFGAPFHGSTGCLSLVQPIVAIQTSSDASSVGTGAACGFSAPQAPGGYRFVAADGGVFSFGNAAFAGSLGGQGVTDVVGMADG